MNPNHKKYMAMLMLWDILQHYKKKPNHITAIDMECGSITLDEAISVVEELGREYESAPWGRDEKIEPLPSHNFGNNH
jgi:hypothetical protein